jgi:hypothetical protein
MHGKDEKFIHFKNLRRRDHLEDQDLEGRIVIKWTLKKHGVTAGGLDSSGAGQEPTERCGRVITTPVSYSRGPWLKSPPGNRLSRMRVLKVFLSFLGKSRNTTSN